MLPKVIGVVTVKYKNRLAELRGKSTQAEFAARLGLKQANYWKYENGKQRLNSDLIERVCQECGCTAEWLLCMDNSPSKASFDDGYTKVPLYGSIAAGTPLEMIEVDDSFPIPAEMAARHPSAFLLKVKGESMNRKLPNGCYALVDPERKDPVLDNRAYAVCVNGCDATVKRVKKLNNGFELVPDSTDPTYKPTLYDYGVEGTETITVMGEVVWYAVPFDFEI